MRYVTLINSFFNNLHKVFKAGALATFVFVAFIVCTLFCPANYFAYAETDNIDGELTAAQEQVESSAKSYDEAVARVSELDEKISQNEAEIAELEAKLPSMQTASDNAFVMLYILQSNGGTLLDLMLTAQDFSDFLKVFEYFQIIEEQMLASINELNSSLSLLEETKSELATEKEEALLAQTEAETALEEAKAAREAAQEAARIAAEEEAAARAAEEAAANDAGSTDEESGSGSSGGSIDTTPSDDGADWSSDKDTFVSSWGARLDAYLSGSPLSGYGQTFAAAAWDYGIDPRFSAAISTIESSKGAYCFRSYNAWGWGSVSWSSWEEAIYAHAKGLARGYGYTVSESGAQKYCPGNWQNWYNKVSSEMNKI